MSAEAFDPTDWAGYFEITSDATKINEAVGVVSFDLSLAPASFWSNVESDGKDIRVTNDDASFAYSRQILNFSVGSETGVVVFDSSSVISTSVNKTWRIYSGNAAATEPAATDTLGRENIFASAQKAMYNLEESGNGTAGEYIDSTSTRAHGRGGDGTAGAVPTQVAGQVGKGQSFDGGDHIGSLGTVSDFSFMANTGVFSAEFWVKFDSVSTNRNEMIWSNGLSDSATKGITLGHLSNATAGNRLLRAYFYNGSGVTTFDSSTNPISDANWHHIGIAFNGTGAVWYVDGVALTTSGTVPTLPTGDSTRVYNIGRENRFNSSKLFGDLDQVRIFNDTRTANYFSTVYNNESSQGTFWSVGAWTAPAAGNPWYYNAQQLALCG